MNMKKMLMAGIAVLLVLVNVACGSKGNTAKSAPRDGTYTFNPRPQATSAGQPVTAYLDKITVKNGYIAFYLTSVPNGKGNLKDIPGHWGWGNSHGTVVLQNLDNQDLSYTDADGGGLTNPTGQYVAFDSVVGYRFSLSDQENRPQIVFNKIVLSKPDKADGSAEKFIYAMTGFDPMDFTEMDFGDLLATTQKGNVDGMYVSEVVFVRQSGKDLTFETTNGNKSKKMQTFENVPTGLSEGQKVRIYYRAYYQSTSHSDPSGDFSTGTVREGWGVYAIEPL
jgi:hypothetical protein